MKQKQRTVSLHTVYNLFNQQPQVASINCNCSMSICDFVWKTVWVEKQYTRFVFWTNLIDAAVKCRKNVRTYTYFTIVPCVQVWNADFRQQMAHQSSLCYKDLTLRHFVVSSTSVRRTRVLNWISVCTVLCCCIQYVEIYTEERAFGNNINFCFHMKKTAAELYRLFREIYSEHVPSQDTCKRWFRCFKSGDFEVADKQHGKPE